MFTKAQRALMRPSYAQIIEALKRSDGMPISDLARELGMSYMGVKQHCLKLVEKGYLEEWRIPRGRKEIGRPEKLYRLTDRCDELFPQAGVSLSLSVLANVRDLYGEAAPEKLLLTYFRDLQKGWQPKVRKGKSLVEKATRLTDLRDQAGWFSRCYYRPETGFRIEEFHNPMAPIYAVYPSAIRMELQMIEQLLGSKVHRADISVGKGRRRTVYEIATLGMPSDEVTPRRELALPDFSQMGDLFRGL